MKNHLLRALIIPLITGCFALNTCETALAQVPQGIPYQAIARNASGVAIANTAVKVRFSIRDSIATGAIKYQETHNPTTSALGLFSVNVGMGTVVSGTFSGINWGKNAKFLQVELNITGGTTYTDLGTTQMMSVPYALFAGQTIASSTSSEPIFSMISNPAPVILPERYNFYASLNYCFNLIEGGFSDWRLPSLDEWLNYSKLNGIPQSYYGWTTTYDGTTWWTIQSGPSQSSLGSTSFVQINCVR